MIYFLSCLNGDFAHVFFLKGRRTTSFQFIGLLLEKSQYGTNCTQNIAKNKNLLTSYLITIVTKMGNLKKHISWRKNPFVQDRRASFISK